MRGGAHAAFHAARLPFASLRIHQSCHFASRLYFAGVELPTLVYYSSMHCDFIKPRGGPESVTAPNASAAPPLDRNDLALAGPQGDLLPIANFGREWNTGGPGAHR
jgi:hypothetical protein